MSNSNSKKIPKAEVEQAFRDGLSSSDQLRSTGLINATKFQQKKVKLERAEQKRLIEKHGTEHILVSSIESKLNSRVHSLSAIKIESARSQLRPDKCPKDTWMATGHVYDRTGCPIESANVSAHRLDGTQLKMIAAAKTDKNGTYVLNFKANAEQLKVLSSQNDKKVDNAEEPQPEKEEAIKIMASLDGNKSVCSESAPVKPKLGNCSVRDLMLDFDQSSILKVDLSKDRRSYKLLGNSASRELHNLGNEKPNCNIDLIRPDHCVGFKSEEQALELDYDYCAYCFGRELSKR